MIYSQECQEYLTLDLYQQNNPLFSVILVWFITI